MKTKDETFVMKRGREEVNWDRLGKGKRKKKVASDKLDVICCCPVTGGDQLWKIKNKQKMD